MKDNLKDLADLLYTSFLARDFFAKVMPGAILLLAAVASPPDSQFTLETIKELPMLGWCLLYGVCYLTGFVVQAIGERTGIIHAYPRDENEQAFRDRWSKFNSSNIPQSDRISRERYVVIKEMTGNFGLALCLSLLVVAINCLMPTTYTLFIQIVFVFIAACALLWYHLVHQERQRNHELTAIKNSLHSSTTKDEEPPGESTHATAAEMAALSQLP